MIPLLFVFIFVDIFGNNSDLLLHLSSYYFLAVFILIIYLIPILDPIRIVSLTSIISLVRNLFFDLALMIWGGHHIGCQILHRRDSQHGRRRGWTATLTGLLLLRPAPSTAYQGWLSPQPLILHCLRCKSDIILFLPQYCNADFLVTLTTTALHLDFFLHSY